ncbi:MAG: hypothetical protein LBV67_08130 [Streptococcaceae bacterium]|jgi:hypothetical protein|nr:hypothetical protein [Streptococcaceae bacterium]
MRKIKLVASYILTFITILFFFMGVSLGVLTQTLLNQNFMISAIDTSGYIETITREINEEIADLARASNLPPERLTSAVSESVVEDNVHAFIRAIYTDVPFTLSGQAEITHNLETIITQVADERGLDISTHEAQEPIQRFIQESLIRYERYIEIPILLTYARQIMSFKGTLTIILVMVGVFGLILAIGSILTSGRWRHVKIRMVSTIFGGTGLMLATLPLYLQMSGYVERLGVRSSSLYDFIVVYISSFIRTFISLGFVFLAIALMIFFLSEHTRKRVAKKPKIMIERQAEYGRNY